MNLGEYFLSLGEIPKPCAKARMTISEQDAKHTKLQPKIDKLLLKYGHDFSSLPRITYKEFKGQCHSTSLIRSIEHQELQLCTGFGTVLGRTICHSWCITPTGVLIDYMWDDLATSYIGVVLSKRYALRAAKNTTKVTSLILDWRRDYPMLNNFSPNMLSKLRHTQKRLEYKKEDYE